MNLTNARIGKLWTGGLTDVTKIARKIGRPGPAGVERVVQGLLALKDKGEITGFPPIPALEPWCGSWIVVRRATGEVIGEFFDRAAVERFNPATCEVRTAQQHLAAVNRALTAEKPREDGGGESG